MDGDVDDIFDCFTSGLIFIDPFNPLTYLAALAAGELYCDGAGDRSCQLIDKSSVPEIPDGLDNNCDGVWPGDERCDGLDGDADGRVDEGAGSCLERHLFVPVCWVGGDQADFNGVVNRAERFFQESTLLNECALDRTPALPQKIWYEAAPLGTVTCPPGATTADHLSAITLLDEVKTHYDLRDWDYLTFVTRLPANANCIAGSTPGGGLVSMRSEGLNTPFEGEHVVFAHEWGHNIADGSGVGLGEEYRVHASRPNTVRASLGCDPATCCNNAHCNPGIDGMLCLGNEAKDLTGWSWGDPPPPTFGDGSRCIMSNASAPGALTGDPITGAGSHRRWCQACLDHLNLFAPKCIHNHAGPQRRLELAGRVDANGDVTLVHYDLGDGRMGPVPAQDGEIEIEAYDATGTYLGTFAPSAVSHQPEIHTAARSSS